MGKKTFLRTLASFFLVLIFPIQIVQASEFNDGVSIGSWNTQVEFDRVQITLGAKLILNESFNSLENWQQEGGDWSVAHGVCRQSSNLTPALLRKTFKNSSSHYTISIHARKTGGAEGFLVAFGVRDTQNFFWLNLGGWNNTAHRLEKSVDGDRQPISPVVRGTIETGKWYDIKIEVDGSRIQCFLDGQQIVDQTDESLTSDSPTLPADNDKLNFGQALIPDMVADPSICDVDGTFYCYATTDGWGHGLDSSGTPVVWKSQDFLNWSFDGSSFPSDFDLKYWAPSSIIHKNGQYYSFPTLDGKITEVKADTPVGPFLSMDGTHVTKAHHQNYPVNPCTIDAEVFVDDDGQAYMVWQLRHLTKLKADLSSPEGPTVTIPTKRAGYSEGPYLTKRNGIYYYFYTLRGDENYQYAYMISHTSPMGPWEAPDQDIIATTDHSQKIFGPGHGCFFHPKDSDQWYFVYLEYGRGGTTRQIYADKMFFNDDGTIQPIKLTKSGVGALRPNVETVSNLALTSQTTASSTLPKYRVRPRADPSLNRIETYSPLNAVDGLNGTRWMAASKDAEPWFQVDLGGLCNVLKTEAYFVKPAAGHAYRLEYSLDGQTWIHYGGHDDIIQRSPHSDQNTVKARYFKLTILKGEPGLWEFRVYGNKL